MLIVLLILFLENVGHLLRQNDFKKNIKMLIRSKNINVVAATLVHMIKMNIPLPDMKYKRKYELLVFLSKSVKKPGDDEDDEEERDMYVNEKKHEELTDNQKQMVAKALTIFFDKCDNNAINEYLHVIYYNGGSEILARLYTFYDELNNNLRNILQSYIPNCDLLYEDFILIKDKKGDNSHINNILSIPQDFSYNSVLCDIIKHFDDDKDEVHILPNTVNRGCKYSIKPSIFYFI